MAKEKNIQNRKKIQVKMSIQKKVQLLILPVITIAFVILIITSYQTSKTSIQSKTIELLEVEALANTNSIDAWRREKALEITKARRPDLLK